MRKPRLKDCTWVAGQDEIILHRELGVMDIIPDPGGRVVALLELADGTRSVAEMTEALNERWPSLTSGEVIEALTSLDEAGLVEDWSAGCHLSARQSERYASNLAFFGTFASLDRSRYSFQESLRGSHVLLLGVGGLGSTLLYNLGGLGVGDVTVLDCDKVELKNLVRQFLYSEADIGQPKLARAVARASAFNSEMRITPVERRVSGPMDVACLLQGIDLVLSAVDRPEQVQVWVNQACVDAGVPFVTGGMQVARGLYYSVDPGRSGCLQCLSMAASGGSLNASPLARPERINRGIAPVASLMGALIGLEAVRYLTRFASPVSAGRLWLADFATGQIEVGHEWNRLADCPVCAAPDSAGLHLDGAGSGGRK
jgi:molybdopterin/thiamine biosynthesis adenylyltransferase